MEGGLVEVHHGRRAIAVGSGKLNERADQLAGLLGHQAKISDRGSARRILDVSLFQSRDRRMGQRERVSQVMSDAGRQFAEGLETL